VKAGVTVLARHPAGGLADDLSGRLRGLHGRMLAIAPTIDRIACTRYDPATDLLKTFVNSTRSGEAIADDACTLTTSSALQALAQGGGVQVIQDIPATVQGTREHSRWLRRQGYGSSLTVPMQDNGAFIGFIVYDSLQRNAFTATLQRDLELFSNLINITISSVYAAVRSLRASAAVAQDFVRLRDYETGSHLDRVAHYCRLIAKNLAQPLGLRDAFIEQLFFYATLHDIGKIGIPDAILLKEGNLTPEERQVIQTHGPLGLQILEKVIGKHALRDLPDSTLMRNIVDGHHERLDGSGYPLGLRGEAIPLEARIVAVADVFDAITCRRPYRQPQAIEAGLAELEHQAAGGLVDSLVVAALTRQRADVEAIRQRFQDD
jgi:HD-GYP domain-containing protein (c-di-GMP phosphodiesterase class II)